MTYPPKSTMALTGYKLIQHLLVEREKCDMKRRIFREPYSFSLCDKVMTGKKCFEINFVG